MYLQDIKFLWAMLSPGKLYTDDNTDDDDDTDANDANNNDTNDNDKDTW